MSVEMWGTEEEERNMTWIFSMSEQVLFENFKFNSFRSHQKKIIDEVHKNKDQLVILPTGSGKSLLFQYQVYTFWIHSFLYNIVSVCRLLWKAS